MTIDYDYDNDEDEKVEENNTITDGGVALLDLQGTNRTQTHEEHLETRKFRE